MVFKSLIHFPFIRAYGVRTGSSFIFFACICPVFPFVDHLLTIIFTPCMFLPPLSNTNCR